MLDEKEFLSPYGIRALSRYHWSNRTGWASMVRYTAWTMSLPSRLQDCLAATPTGAGPIWIPVLKLSSDRIVAEIRITTSAMKYKVECPTGSGQMMTLWEVAAELSRRLDLTRVYFSARRLTGGARFTVARKSSRSDPHWKDLDSSSTEYFDGDNGAGIGASHQTGWTGLVAKLLQQSGE